MDKSNYIAIGKILGTSGLKGWVKVLNYSEMSGRFDEIKRFWLHTDSGLQGVLIEEVDETIKGPVIKIKNINSKADAERLNGCEIYIEYDQRVQLPEDTFFIHDLMGVKVFDAKNNPIGEVVNVMTGAGNDIYEIKDDKGREILVPAISKFVRNIDIDKKRMDVELIEGMLPEDED